MHVISSRLTGLQWTKGAIRDTLFTDCRLDLSSFRFSKFSSVVFERCNLRQADFQHADLRGARFVDCELVAAQFSNAKVDGTSFVRCALDGIGGVTSLRGAQVRATDAVALLRTLAGALGITIVDDDDEGTRP